MPIDTDSELQVVALLQARPGVANDIAREVAGLVTPSRSEAANRAYGAFRVAEDPSRFVFIESWADAAAFEAHLASEHMSAFLARADELLAAPPEVLFLEQLTPSGEPA